MIINIWIWKSKSISLCQLRRKLLFVIFWYIFGGHFVFFRIWRSKRHISAWQQPFLDSAGPNYPKNTCCQKLTTNALTLLQSLLFWKWDQTKSLLWENLLHIRRNFFRIKYDYFIGKKSMFYEGKKSFYRIIVFSDP